MTTPFASFGSGSLPAAKEGERAQRYFGVKIPPSLLEPDNPEQAQAFANELADRLYGKDELAARPERANGRAGST